MRPRRPYTRLEHEWHKCSCRTERCPYCGGGLSLCRVCNCAEGELLASCPGFRLNQDASNAITDGQVVDFLFWHELKQKDFQLFQEVLRRKRQGRW